MKKIIGSFVLAFAVLLSMTALARTRTRVLLTTCDNGMCQTQILMFEVLEDGTWDYVRTFIHPFDGHCRIPMSACVVDGTAYVLECAGYDDRTAAAPTAARVLKYDLDGNFLGVHVPQVKSWSTLFCSGDYLTFTPDKEWLILGSMRYCTNPSLFKYSVASGAYLPNNGNHIIGGLVGANNFNVTTDYTIPLTCNKYVSQSSGLNLYTNDTTTARWAQHEILYQLNGAKTAYVDESTTPRRLYVGGYNAGYKVFAEGNNTIPLKDGTSNTHISQIAKVADRMYVVQFDSANVYMLDPATLAIGAQALGNGVRNLYGLQKIYAFNAYEETVEDMAVEIAHWKFDEPSTSGIFTNSISSKWPIRAIKLNGGAAGVSGNSVCFNTKYARGIIKDSGKMLGSDYGVFFWICSERADYLTYKAILSSRLENDSCFWHLGFNNSTAAPWLFTKSVSSFGRTSSDVLTDGTWRHFGLVKKGTSLTFYFDGEKAGEWKDLTGLGGFDDGVDYVLGASGHQNSLFLYNWNSGGAVYLDELRVFDGAPTAAQVAEVYGSHTAPTAPSAPALPSHDSTIARRYGTIVAHSFANSPAYTAPSIVYDASTHRLWVSFGTDSAVTALDATTTFLYSDNDGVNWSLVGYSAPIAQATLFQKDATTYAFGRTVSDPATGGRVFSNGSYQTQYLDPTNECDISCGYQVVNVETKSVLATFTNDVNMIRFRDARVDEPDLVSWQILTPGTMTLENGRYVQPYLLGDKVGTISFAMNGSGQPVDFQSTAATVTSSASFVSPHVNVPTTMLPGSDRPFAVKYDAKRECTWALTTPNGTALELYATKNGGAWTKALTVFAVEEMATTRVANPAFDIAGTDLAIAFTLCCPDGGAPTSDLDSPNYVMSRTVERFRQYCPWQPGTTLLFR